MLGKLLSRITTLSLKSIALKINLMCECIKTLCQITELPNDSQDIKSV